MLWTEPAGSGVNPGMTRGSTHFSVVWLSETVYSEIRRFIVISNKGSFSQCMWVLFHSLRRGVMNTDRNQLTTRSPVQTYRRQGTKKAGLNVEDHALIYTGDYGSQPPPLLEDEHLDKHPLRVQPSKNEYLDPESRVNFGKPYAVEHNVKVVEIGMIAQEHMHYLVNHFKEGMGV